MAFCLPSAETDGIVPGLANFLLDEGGVADLGESEHIERSARKVDHGRGGDADFGANKRTLAVVFGDGHRAARLVEQTNLPQWRIAGTNRVERVHVIVLGGNKQNVVLSIAGDVDCRHEKRLRVDRTVDFERAQLAELIGVEVLRG